MSSTFLQRLARAARGEKATTPGQWCHARGRAQCGPDCADYGTCAMSGCWRQCRGCWRQHRGFRLCEEGRCWGPHHGGGE